MALPFPTAVRSGVIAGAIRAARLANHIWKATHCCRSKGSPGRNTEVFRGTGMQLFRVIITLLQENMIIQIMKFMR